MGFWDYADKNSADFTVIIIVICITVYYSIKSLRGR